MKALPCLRATGSLKTAIMRFVLRQLVGLGFTEMSAKMGTRLV